MHCVKTFFSEAERAQKSKNLKKSDLIHISAGFSPYGRRKLGCRWPWREQRCLRWEWCQPERRSEFPTATKSSSSCSTASCPRRCSQMDWWRERGKRMHRVRYLHLKDQTQVCKVEQDVWVPEVVQIGDLLHAEPAELAAADGTGHVIAAPVVHLDDVGATAGAWLDVISWRQRDEIWA